MSELQALRVVLGSHVLELAKQSLALCGLSVDGESWLAPGQPDGSPLWEAVLVDADGRRATLTGRHARRCNHRIDDAGATLVWEAVTDAPTGAGPIDVTVRIQSGQPAPLWRIEVRNLSDVWTLWSVTFPILTGLVPSAAPEQDELFYPQGWGTRHRGWANMPNLRRRSSRGWDFAMQFFGYTRGRRTLYLGTHDPGQSPKEFQFDRADQPSPHARATVVHYPAGMSLPGNSFAPAYDVVAGVLDGDWYDAARLYGDWGKKQPWAALPPNRHAPARQVQAWQLIQFPDKQADEWAEQMEQLSARLGVKLGIHFYNWHEIPFDINYPDYFPARQGFKELVARVRRAGIRAMPYINGRIWDINSRSWTERSAERFAVKYSALRLNPRALFTYLEEYGSGQKLAPMCPTTAFWRETVVVLCRRIIHELGCDGVYLDQIAAEKAETCFDRSHGHAPGGGSYWLEGYRQLMREIRAAVGPDVLLTTECNWDACIADFDGLLMWHSVGPGLIPLFPAAYSGFARTFACQFNRATIAENGGSEFARRMGMLLVWGAELGWGDLTPLLEPQHAEVCNFFARLCHLRFEHQDTFLRGTMLRPPTVSAESVQAALWQKPAAKDATLFLVNPTRDAVQCAVTLPRECATQAPQGKLSIDMHALSSRTIELR